jgi:putative transcriptional regulator
MGKAFEEIHAGLQDALKHAKGEKSGVIEHKPRQIDVKVIRKKPNESAKILHNID